ncbi:MAG: type II toxin-antitoxin system Phd/YefM family antitoxin [Erysipelotrichaceae bacterium]
MPKIRPISDLRNNSGEISDYCKETREPIFITKNGIGDMVVMSIETYERQEAQLDLYCKLAEAEVEILNGDEGADFSLYANKMRDNVHGRL